MALLENIDQSIKAALLGKDQVTLRGLRAIKAALLVAKTEKGASENLTEEAEIKILQKMVKQRKESAEIYKQQNRQDLLNVELEEISVIESFLPKPLSPEELEVAIKSIIEETGATNVKDLGKVMGLASQRLGGSADGKSISAIAKALLQ